MKAKFFIEYDPEERFESDKAQRMMQADEAWSALWDLAQALRTYEKYTEDKNADNFSQLVQELRERIYDTNLDELWT